MERTTFTVARIEGEYAYLVPREGGDEVFVAIALLPLGADVGTAVVCESFSFSLCEE